ncbi:MAG: hypothetical protein H0T76_28630 [Nannocystis sp.]|nr:hypothetical protein [Nannocystis sp.]MBA3550460.1 hypothetical protein [Nannocystis sp.]
MKRVLFIGDGDHDIGKPEWPTDDAFPARGVVPLLAERVTAIDRPGSMAMHWAHPRLARFSVGRPTKTHGYPEKFRAAQLQVEYGRLPVEGIVCVVDEDKKPERLQLPGNAQELTTKRCPIVCGVAVQSIEAWTLGALTALADVLGITIQKLRRACPAAPVEDLYEGSGKEGRQPKPLLNELAERFAHRRDSLELREEVAARTDIAELVTMCPTGFAPFAAALRRCFGPPIV